MVSIRADHSSSISGTRFGVLIPAVVVNFAGILWPGASCLSRKFSVIHLGEITRFKETNFKIIHLFLLMKGIQSKYNVCSYLFQSRTQDIIRARSGDCAFLLTCSAAVFFEIIGTLSSTESPSLPGAVRCGFVLHLPERKHGHDCFPHWQEP